MLKRSNLVKFVFVFLSFVIGFYFGDKYSIHASKFDINSVEINRKLPDNHQDLTQFNLFWKVWDTLSNEYVDKSKLDAKKMIYGAISGMVSGVGDPYTSFLTPEDNKLVEEDLGGNFEGIGIQIGFKGTQLTVIAPLPGTPAAKAGILTGDKIIGLKDEVKKIDISTNGMSLSDAVKIIRGPKGSTISLALLRGESTDPMVVNVTRAQIEVPSVVLTPVGENGNIAHLQVLKFSEDTKGEWDKAVTEILKNSKIDRIVLDLRNNPGGYLQSAVDLASDFVPVNSVVVKEEKGNGETSNFTSRAFPRLEKYPVTILVNGGSASASEILAGALHELKNFKLVGNQTFGKGTIQEPLQLEGGAGLHITVAKWLTPNGTWVHEKGLEPDFKIDDNPETPEDEQLNKALEF